MVLPLSLVHLHKEERNFGVFLHGTLRRNNNNDDYDDDGKHKRRRRSQRIKIANTKHESNLRVFNDQRGLLENIWSFVKTDVNSRRYVSKVHYTSCLGVTEGVWVEKLEREEMGSLFTMLIMNYGTPTNDEDKTEMERRQRFHDHWQRGCRCGIGGLCGGLPGDTITYCNDEYEVYSMTPATEQELRERGYFGKAAVPTHFWE